MNDRKQQNEQDELRDLDVPEEQANEVKGGFGVGQAAALAVAAANAGIKHAFGKSSRQD
jgi:hypothetical protein